MNLRDENVLREMNLYPLWVRKEMSAHSEQTSVEVTQEVEAQTIVDVAPVEAIRHEEKSIAPASGWDELKAQVKGCTACKLREGCTQTVFGVGDENADWLFVGEGPGADEDAQGEPFVGQAGKLLDNMLASIKLKRGHNVYIANVVKCRPPNNRTPEKDEAETCLPYLKQQIALVKPKLIVALGKTAASSLLSSDATLGSLRGKLHQVEGIPVLVTYHPAYLLRAPAEKTRAWGDLCLAIDVMSKSNSNSAKA